MHNNPSHLENSFEVHCLEDSFLFGALFGVVSWHYRSFIHAKPLDAYTQESHESFIDEHPRTLSRG